MCSIRTDCSRAISGQTAGGVGLWLALPNSSNAPCSGTICLKRKGGPRTPEAGQHLQQLLRLGLPTQSTRTGNTLRWMPYLTVALSPMRPLQR